MDIHISLPHDISEVDKLDDDDSVEKLKADLVDAHAQVVLTAAAVTIIDREDEWLCHSIQQSKHLMSLKRDLDQGSLIQQNDEADADV
jgi:hypothetical protein